MPVQIKSGQEQRLRSLDGNARPAHRHWLFHTVPADPFHPLALVRIPFFTSLLELNQRRIIIRRGQVADVSSHQIAAGEPGDGFRGWIGVPDNCLFENQNSSRGLLRQSMEERLSIFQV